MADNQHNGDGAHFDHYPMYRSTCEGLAAFGPEVELEVRRAIDAYMLDGIEPEFENPMSQGVWTLISVPMIRTREKRVAGMAGGKLSRKGSAAQESGSQAKAQPGAAFRKADAEDVAGSSEAQAQGGVSERNAPMGRQTTIFGEPSEQSVSTDEADDEQEGGSPKAEHKQNGSSSEADDKQTVSKTEAEPEHEPSKVEADGKQTVSRLEGDDKQTVSRMEADDKVHGSISEAAAKQNVIRLPVNPKHEVSELQVNGKQTVSSCEADGKQTVSRMEAEPKYEPSRAEADNKQTVSRLEGDNKQTVSRLEANGKEPVTYSKKEKETIDKRQEISSFVHPALAGLNECADEGASEPMASVVPQAGPEMAVTSAEACAETAAPKASVPRSSAMSVIRSAYRESFQRFWDAYPRNQKKKDAAKAWNQLAPDAELAEFIITAVERNSACNPSWRNKQYVPLASTWLRGERWNDELPESEPAGGAASWGDGGRMNAGNDEPYGSYAVYGADGGIIDPFEEQYMAYQDSLALNDMARTVSVAASEPLCDDWDSSDDFDRFIAETERQKREGSGDMAGAVLQKGVANYA